MSLLEGIGLNDGAQPPRKSVPLVREVAADKSQAKGVEASCTGAALAPQAVPNKRTLQRVSAGAFGDDDATVARGSPSSLVLITRRRGALRERPYAVGEFQHQQAIVLASRPQRTPRRVKVNLRRATE